jgi:tyrosyl-DNA phosphodiesterase 2
VAPLSDVCFEMIGESFISKIREWRMTPYFTVMMVPRQFGQINCFRIPFRDSIMGRDALCVDIPVSSPDGDKALGPFLRLCTTHLESLMDKPERGFQLATISRLLKGEAEKGIVAGFVGGDMNANDASEHENHKAADVELKDAWEDVPHPPVPKLKPFQKDLTYGRAKGNTFGYQSTKMNNRKRLDKFFYTGLLETIALTEPQDVTGKVGRLGIGLTTEVVAWECEKTELRVVRGKLVEKTFKEYYSDRQMETHRKYRKENWPEPVRRKIDAWVSDHFGIATGTRAGSFN